MPKFQPSPLPPQPFLDASQKPEAAPPAFSWKVWFESVQQWLSSKGAPATSISAGTPLQIQGLETDGTYLYVAIGVNRWKRVLLSDF